MSLNVNKLQRCHGSAPFGGAAAGATARVIAGAIEKPQSIEDFRQGRSDEGERGRPRWRLAGWHRSSRRRTSRGKERGMRIEVPTDASLPPSATTAAEDGGSQDKATAAHTWLVGATGLH